jgi:hypothetical protein
MTAAAETPREKLFSRWGGEIPKETPPERDVIAGREGLGRSTEAVLGMPVPLYYYCCVPQTRHTHDGRDRLCAVDTARSSSAGWFL